MEVANGMICQVNPEVFNKILNTVATLGQKALDSNVVNEGFAAHLQTGFVHVATTKLVNFLVLGCVAVKVTNFVRVCLGMKQDEGRTTRVVCDRPCYCGCSRPLTGSRTSPPQAQAQSGSELDRSPGRNHDGNNFPGALTTNPSSDQSGDQPFELTVESQNDAVRTSIPRSPSGGRVVPLPPTPPDSPAPSTPRPMQTTFLPVERVASSDIARVTPRPLSSEYAPTPALFAFPLPSDSDSDASRMAVSTGSALTVSPTSTVLPQFTD